MAQFVNDTFTDSNKNLNLHVGETGATWVYHPDNATSSLIASNKVEVGSTNTTSVAYASGTPAGADYDVVADYTKTAGTTQVYWGLMARMNTVAGLRGYLFRWVEGITSWQLYEFASTGTTKIGETPASAADGTFNLKLVCTDANKEGWVDGTKVVENSAYNGVTDKGKAGIRIYTGWLERHQFDNFNANDIAVAGPTGNPNYYYAQLH